MVANDFMFRTKQLIDELKGICANYGLGNDGNEFKIITQVFLYKFMNDKFLFEAQNADPKIGKSGNAEQALKALPEAAYEKLLFKIDPNTARLYPRHFISVLHDRQNGPEFAKLFDDTLREIGTLNSEIFSVKTFSGSKIILFDELSNYITDSSLRDNFCKAIINKVVNAKFESFFNQKFDFFATIFEYLIKDYNIDSGGKYAEYYTPHAVAKIMASILVDQPAKDNTLSCYDPAAGSGTLLMNLAHAIGEDRCSIYSQDISQKSSGMLRLNLILNNLVHSIQNIVQGNTLELPYHRKDKFDYIVSNPPFKLDFSDYRERLDSKENHERFFAGIPKVPVKDKDKMSIYLLFIQHIMFSLSKKGRAAIVVPTGFITAQTGIEKKIREQMVQSRMLRGVVSMPSNIFATTGTNVSILFLDKANTKGDIVLMDASRIGKTVKEGKNQRTVLSEEEEQYIIETFNAHKAVEDFSVVVSYADIEEKNYSFSAGQYFDVKIEYADVTADEFEAKIEGFTQNLDRLFAESAKLEKEIKKQMEGLRYG